MTDVDLTKELDQELDRALRDKLPNPPMSVKLRSRLEAMAPGRPRRIRPAVWVVPMLAAAAAAALVVAWPARAPSSLLREAVNDHLRVVYRENPVDVQSGGIHAVKPWFTGRLDFSPPVTFSGDDEFPLAGGAVGYFIDRKCAVMVFHRKAHTADGLPHTITLLVAPAAGLGWPASPTTARERGFATLLWREGDLGFALVSDVDPADLEALRGRLHK